MEVDDGRMTLLLIVNDDDDDDDDDGIVFVKDGMALREVNNL